MTSEFEPQPSPPPPPLKRYKVQVAFRRESTHKAWVVGDTVDSVDIPGPAIQRLVKRGVLKEIIGG